MLAYKRNNPTNDHDEEILQRRIKTRDVCVATRQLATLLLAGMPLVPALTALVEQLRATEKNAGKSSLAQVFQQITDRVNAGDSLADALRRYPGIFSNLFVNMVRAGQASGTLEEILIKQAEMLEKRAQLTARLKAALAYPALMIISAVGVVWFLMAFVVPGIVNIFLEMNHTLPWPTRLLIMISSFLTDYAIVIGLVFCVLIMCTAAYLKTKNGKNRWDRLKLQLPWLGELSIKVEIIRFSRTLGVMLSSGIPILEAIEIVRGIIQNSFVAESLDAVRNDIGSGHSIAHAIRQTGLFPPIMVHTIAIGEMSGNVEQQFANLADGYDEEIKLMVQSMTALIEPVILLFMGLIVGFIVLAILLPIFEINQML
ncbi:MAG: type II secretion system F family protein [Sedimentisphaerales bacterium]|nr:type II secretion system F family protein [Sedimentisphaerales bacterium]